MKKIYQIFVFLSLSSFIFTNCKKSENPLVLEDSTPVPTPQKQCMMTAELGPSGNHTYDYTYNDKGQLVQMVFHTVPAMEDSYRFTYEYNDKGQLFKITGNVEASNYLLLTYDDHGDVVKIERISQTNPAIRITQAQFEYDTSRPARILPEQLEVLHGLDFLIQKHLCKRAYYSIDAEGKSLVQVDFKIYKRTDAGKPEWEWVDVQWNTNLIRTYSLEYECK